MEEYESELEFIKNDITAILDDEWEDDVQRTYFRIENDDYYGDEVNEEDEDNFRKQFVQDHTADDVLNLLKNNKVFMKHLSRMIKAYADEKDIPTYLASQYEPDWEAIEEFRRAS